MTGGGLETVPPLQDRRHRNFLKSLRQRVAQLSVTAAGTQDVTNLRGEMQRGLAALRTSINALQQDVDALEGGQQSAGAEGKTVVSAEAFGTGDVLIAGDAGAERADNGTASHAGRVIGLAGAPSNGAGFEVPLIGPGDLLDFEGWAWTVGDVLWVATLGNLSTDPGEGEFQYPVAIALSATTVLVAKAGPFGLDKAYTHTQDLAATEWVVVHGLEKYPSVVLRDTSGREIHAEIQHDSHNALRVRHSIPRSGSAHCN